MKYQVSTAACWLLTTFAKSGSGSKLYDTWMWWYSCWQWWLNNKKASKITQHAKSLKNFLITSSVIVSTSLLTNLVYNPNQLQVMTVPTSPLLPHPPPPPNSPVPPYLIDSVWEVLIISLVLNHSTCQHKLSKITELWIKQTKSINT